jgi:hypothetical protein
MRPLTLACLLVAGLSLPGCAGGQASSSAASQLPSPASGTAWRAVGGEGSLTAQGTVPPGGAPVVSVDASGNIRASIPASGETQQAGAALAPGSFGALQIRNAP